MDEGVKIAATISDKNVVSSFVGYLPLQQNASFGDVLYSQTFGTTDLNNLISCVSLNMFSEILRGFADEKTIDFLDSYKIFIPDAENVYIALSLIMNNLPSIQVIVFSIGEESIFGFDGVPNDIKFSLMTREKNSEIYYSSLINHEHYHEVFGNLKEPIGLLYLKYGKDLLNKNKSMGEYHTFSDYLVANVVKIVFNALDKIDPAFSVSTDFLIEDFKFANINHYFINEAIKLNVNVLDFLIAR
jgi:hypothetical protein